MTDPAALRDRLAEIREQGYAIVHDDLQVGIGSIAYPVLDRDGSVRAAVGVTLLSESLDSPQEREEHQVLTANLAATISNSLGWNPLYGASQ